MPRKRRRHAGFLCRGADRGSARGDSGLAAHDRSLRWRDGARPSTSSRAAWSKRRGMRGVVGARVVAATETVRLGQQLAQGQVSASFSDWSTDVGIARLRSRVDPRTVRRSFSIAKVRCGSAPYDRGVYRLHGERRGSFRQDADGLSSDIRAAIYRGSRRQSLGDDDRRRRSLRAIRPSSAFSVAKDCARPKASSVLASRDGSIWIGGDGALSAFTMASVTCFRTGTNCPERRSPRCWKITPAGCGSASTTRPLGVRTTADFSDHPAGRHARSAS